MKKKYPKREEAIVNPVTKKYVKQYGPEEVVVDPWDATRGPKKKPGRKPGEPRAAITVLILQKLCALVEEEVYRDGISRGRVVDKALEMYFASKKT